MPSPFGHALAGVLTAWMGDLIPGRPPSSTTAPDAPWFDRAGDGLTVTCAVLAASPDIDLLFEAHRTVTHSVGAVILVAVAAAWVASRRRRPAARIAVTCAAAYASHLLLDWMAVDETFPRGLQALWPFGHRFYISGWNLFRQTERRAIFSPAVIRLNAGAVAQEVLIFMPVLVAVWLIRVKTLARFTTEMPCSHQTPQ